MDTADELYKTLLSWMPMRETSAEHLIGIANELDQLNHDCNVARVATTSVAVAGSLSIVGAGILTVLTAGLATPALVMAVGGTTAAITGAVASGITSLVESLMSSSKMKEAEKIIQVDASTGDKIQQLMKKLKEECKKNPSCSEEAGTSTFFMNAIAKSHGLTLPVSFYQELYAGALVGGIVYNASPQILNGLMKNVGLIGLRTIASAATKVLGGVVGLALSLPELVSSSMDLAKGEPTEASRQLRDASKSIKTGLEELKKNLRPIQKMFEDMARLKTLVKKLRYLSYATQEGQEIINFVKANCNNAKVMAWLEQVQNYPVLLNNIAHFYNQLKEELEKQTSGRESNHINIVFVSHGRISPQSVPAATMMPLGTINDVIIYTPWNCLLDYKAAYMIAVGISQPENRVFINNNDNRRPLHLPYNLPMDWNKLSMTMALDIPLHWVKPVGVNEGVWMDFMNLNARGALNKPPDWFVIPYIMPEGAIQELFPEAPFFVITLALSVMLWFSGRRATIHLAACSGYGNDAQHITDWHIQMCKSQYAYTYDRTYMSNSLVPDTNDQVFDAFKAMFGSPT